MSNISINKSGGANDISTNKLTASSTPLQRQAWLKLITTYANELNTNLNLDGEPIEDLSSDKFLESESRKVTSAGAPKYSNRQLEELKIKLVMEQFKVSQNLDRDTIKFISYVTSISITQSLHDQLLHHEKYVLYKDVNKSPHNLVTYILHTVSTGTVNKRSQPFLNFLTSAQNFFNQSQGNTNIQDFTKLYEINLKDFNENAKIANAANENFGISTNSEISVRINDGILFINDQNIATLTILSEQGVSTIQDLHETTHHNYNIPFEFNENIAAYVAMKNLNKDPKSIEYITANTNRTMADPKSLHDLCSSYIQFQESSVHKGIPGALKTALAGKTGTPNTPINAKKSKKGPSKKARITSKPDVSVEKKTRRKLFCFDCNEDLCLQGHKGCSNPGSGEFAPIKPEIKKINISNTVSLLKNAGLTGGEQIIEDTPDLYESDNDTIYESNDDYNWNTEDLKLAFSSKPSVNNQNKNLYKMLKRILFIDSGSNIIFISNKELLSNVRYENINIVGVNGDMKSNLVGDLPFFGKACLTPKAVINGIGINVIESLCYDIKYYRSSHFNITIVPGFDINFNFIAGPDGYGAELTNEILDKLRNIENALQARNNTLYDQITLATNAIDYNSELVNDAKTIRQRAAYFSKKEVQDAVRANAFIESIGNPTDRKAIEACNRNVFLNNPVLSSHIKNARIIFGPDKSVLKGKSQYRNLKSPINFTRTERRSFENQVLNVDVFWIKNIPYFMSVATPLHITLVSPVIDETSETFTKIINCHIMWLKLYKYEVSQVYSDPQSPFKKILKECAIGIPITTTGRAKHVSVVENNIKTLKERVRVILARLVFNLPRNLEIDLIFFVVQCLNIIPRKNNFASPRELLTQIKTDYKTISSGTFGTLVQSFAPPEKLNSMKERTIGALLLYPIFNKHGTWKAWCLKTKSYFETDDHTKTPLDDYVIEYINNYAERTEKPRNLKKITQPVEIPKILSFSQSENNSTSKTSSKRKYQRKLAPLVSGGNDTHAENITNDDNFHVNIDKNKIDKIFNPDETTINELKTTDSSSYQTESENNNNLEIKNNNNDQSRYKNDQNIHVQLKEIADSTDTSNTESLNPLPTIMDNSNYSDVMLNNRKSNVPLHPPQMDSSNDSGSSDPPAPRRGTRIKKSIDNWKHIYAYAIQAIELEPAQNFTNNAEDVEILTWYKQVYKLSIAQAIKDHGDPAEESVIAELIQLIEKDVMLFLAPYIKIKTLETAPLHSSLFLKAKYAADGIFEKLKSRLVAGGNGQDKTLYDDISSSTITKESVFMLFAFAAQWGAAVATFDVGGAYLECKLGEDDHVYMFLNKDIVKILIKFYPKLKSHIRDDGRILVKLLKALYGTIQAAKLWYIKLSKILMEYGFEKCPHDPCVFKMVRNSLMTLVGFHVDDLLCISQLDSHIQDLLIFLRSKFKEVTSHKSNTISYLSMMINVEDKFNINISMWGYEQKIIEDFNIYNITPDGRIKSPAGDDLFEISPESELLSKEKASFFHSTVMKFAFLSARVRIELEIAINWLSGRVGFGKTNEKDWSKLVRVYQFLRNNRGSKIYFRKKEKMEIKVWIDASFACHEDRTSRTGSIITLSGGPISVSSKKQKLVSKNSTEAEIVGLTDEIVKPLWVRHVFMWIKSLTDETMEPIEVFQDNEACITIQSTGPKPNHRSKYIDIRFFWVGSLQDQKVIRLVHCRTRNMLADINTKPKHGGDFIVLWKRSTGELIVPNIDDNEWNADDYISLLET